jgi:DNA gyrase/topoisomerase IV subunit A
MLPIANLHHLYQSTFQFLSSHSPFVFATTDDSASESDSSFPLTPRDLSPRPEEELPSLRDELDAADRTHCHSPSSCRSFGTSAAASTLYSMRREHDATKAELSKSQAEAARWEERCKALEKTLKESQNLLKLRDQEIQALKKERDKNAPERHLRERASMYLDRRRSRDAIHHRSNSNQSQLSQQIRLSGDWSEIRDEARRRNGSDPHPDNMSTVSEEERAQARSSETFLNKIDLWSGAQVIQAVQDLNSEVLQFAASATELCTFSKQRPNTAKVNQASSEVATRLGDALSRLLTTRDHSQDPMLVQLALQGCISYCISRALSSFCIGYQSKANITLTQIYTHMSQTGPY